MDPQTLAWTTFVIALIGAGAWVPTIREWFRKPDVHIVLSDELELSYLEFGSVLNISCSFASFKQVALIESLRLSLEHEDGSREEFFCVGLSESSTARSTSGERVTLDKQTRVHTLAIAKDTATERLVMFRGRAQANRVREAYTAFVPVADRIRSTHGEGWQNVIALQKEYDDYRRIVQHGMYWKQGRYRAVMRANVKQLSEPLEQRFNFELSGGDMRILGANLPLIDRFVCSVMRDTGLARPAMGFVFPARIAEGHW